MPVPASPRLRSFPFPAMGILAALATSALACTNRPPGCEHESVERCLWERGVAPPKDRGDEGEGEDPTRAGELDGAIVEETTWSQLDTVVDELAALMGSGLEWPLIDARARELCGTEPLPSSEDEGAPWVCSLATTLEIEGRELLLEVGNGVVSLSTEGLSEQQSSSVLELARETSLDACAEQRFVPVEAAVHQEFQRCTLSAGPLLYVGRFPRDLEADRWQVSIAVVDSG